MYWSWCGFVIASDLCNGVGVCESSLQRPTKMRVPFFKFEIQAWENEIMYVLVHCIGGHTYFMKLYIYLLFIQSSMVLTDAKKSLQVWSVKLILCFLCVCVCVLHSHATALKPAVKVFQEDKNHITCSPICAMKFRHFPHLYLTSPWVLW